MSTDKYHFIEQFSFQNIATIREEDVALLDVFEENEDKVYGIDFLPKAMMNAYIYDSYFNVYYRSKQKEDIAAHKVYEERFLKVILTIMGYSHDTYVESDALLKKHGKILWRFLLMRWELFILQSQERTGAIFIGGLATKSQKNKSTCFLYFNKHSVIIQMLRFIYVISKSFYFSLTYMLFAS